MTKMRPGTSIHQMKVNKATIQTERLSHGQMVVDVDEGGSGSKLRILPILMIVAGLFLGFKLSSIYDQSEYLAGFFGATSAVAQVDGETSDQGVEPENDPADGLQLGQGRSLLDEANRETSSSDTAQQQDAAGSTEFNPNSLTQSEMELLQSLAERRNQINQREAEVELRENLLQATEQRIDEKITELKRIEQTISSLIKTYDEEQEKQLRSLVKIYETMKPKAAAAIFETLEMAILLDVVERMKEAKLALVLQQVTPDRAKEITTELRERRQLPGEIAGG